MAWEDAWPPPLQLEWYLWPPSAFCALARKSGETTRSSAASSTTETAAARPAMANWVVDRSPLACAVL